MTWAVPCAVNTLTYTFELKRFFVTVRKWTNKINPLKQKIVEAVPQRKHITLLLQRPMS
jgi:hypothetical protein